MNRIRKNVRLGVCWLVIMAVTLVPSWGASQTGLSQEARLQVLLKPKEMSVDAKSAVLMDADTGQILVAYNKDDRVPPASFAKVLTLYLVFDSIKRGKLRLTDEVFISKKAWRTGGSKMFVEVNSKIPVEDLIKGIAVVSGNDACVALAEHIYGSTDIFVNMMNETAEKIGMTNSAFKNVHGLPEPDQYTTPYDMALLARSYIRNFPEALAFHSMQTYVHEGIEQRNRNGLLLKDPSVDGLKTGFTEQAGYHLLATAERGNHRLIAVVMGAKSPAVREREARMLLNYGYRNFELLALFTKGQVLSQIPVWKGAHDTVSLVPIDSGLLTVPADVKGAVREERTIPKEVVAPVQQGQVIGNVVIRLHEDIVKKVSLVAQQEVRKAGLFKSLSHSLYLMGKKNTKLFTILAAIFMSGGVGYVFFATRRRKRRRRSRIRF